MNISTRKILLGVLLLALVIRPDVTEANVQFNPVALPENQGGNIAVQIRVASEQSAINAVEGKIHVPENITNITISTGDSAFSLWPTPPVYSIGDRTISFTAGTPAGISEHQDVLLFTLYGKAIAQGDFTITPTQVAAYLSDGKGTSAPTEVKPLTFSVSTLAGNGDTFGNVISRDHDAPALTVVVGQDSSLFDGKYFLSFNGTDAGSGINRFDVAEGWGGFTEANDFYILNDQKQGSLIRVRAIDFAGNSKVVYVWPAHPFAHPVFYLDVLGIAVIIVLLWKRLHLRATRSSSVAQ